MPTLTVRQSGGDYSSLSAALSDASASDIISIEGTWTVDDTSNATVADDNLTIQTDSSSRHPGYWDESQNHYRLVVTGNNHALELSGAFTITLDGVALQYTGSGNSFETFRCVPGTSDAVTITDCILLSDGTHADQDCLYTGFNTAIGTINLENCVIYNAQRGGINSQNDWSLHNSGTVNVNSCTIWGNASGITIQGSGNNFVINVHNTICVANSTQDYDRQTSTLNVSYSIDSDGSIATDASSGTGNLASRTATDNTSPGAGDWVIFEDITNNPFDLRLVDNAENDAQDMHTTDTAHGLTIPSTDIVGTSRPQNTNHDCGAFEISSGAAATLTADPGSLSFSGTAAGLLTGRTLTAAQGSVSLSGTDASLSADFLLTADPGSLSLTGTAADLQADFTLTLDPGSLSMSGVDAGLLRGFTLTAEAGSLSISGQAAGLLAARLLSADVGSLSISGTDAGLLADRLLTLDPGSLSFSGTVADLIKGFGLTAEAGSFSLSGTAAGLIAGRIIVANAGSVSLTGADAGLTADRLVSADPGSLTFLGVTAGLIADRLLSADPGALTFSGTDADLVTEGDVVLVAEAGSFTLTGVSASLIADRYLSADPRAFTMAGQAASLLVSRLLSAEQGSIGFTGADAGLLADLILEAEAGTLSMSGQDASLIKGFLLAAESGSLSLSGQDASLDVARIIVALAGAFSLAGQDASLIYSEENALPEDEFRRMFIAHFRAMR